jgi:hypothetical protein
MILALDRLCVYVKLYVQTGREEAAATDMTACIGPIGAQHKLDSTTHCLQPDAVA